MERFDAVDVAETDAPGDGVDPVGTWTDERSDATAAGSVPGTGAESDATAAGTTGGEQHDSAAGSGTASAARTNDTASAASATDQDSETAPTDSSWGDDTETVVVETAAGEERYVETNVRPLTVDDRQSVALVMRDVTERRERKQRLERQNERLEEFASIVSHDLRNPLQVLGGRLQAIDAEREGDGAVTLDDHVPSMQRSVDRMRTLIDDLLTLARQGETVDEPTTVSLAAVASGAWETTDAPDANLHLRTGRTVAGDDSRVRQLFENLFRNAVEHGGEDVTVVVDDLADDAGFFVADDGPGIPADEREAVLEMGYTNSEDGTGIGLGIVTEVATAHGWDVELAESADGGAQFEFHTDGT